MSKQMICKDGRHEYLWEFYDSYALFWVDVVDRMRDFGLEQEMAEVLTNPNYTVQMGDAIKKKFRHTPMHLELDETIDDVAVMVFNNIDKIKAYIWAQEHIDWDKLDWTDLVSVGHTESDSKATDRGITQDEWSNGDNATARQKDQSKDYRLSKFDLINRLAKINWKSVNDVIVTLMSTFFWNHIPKCDRYGDPDE